MTGRYRLVVQCPTCGAKVRVTVSRTGVQRVRCRRGHAFNITVRR